MGERRICGSEISLGGGSDHVHVVLVFIAHLNSTVGDSWSGHKELVLHLSVVISDKLSLLGGEGQKFTFFFSRESLEFSESLFHFLLDHW